MYIMCSYVHVYVLPFLLACLDTMINTRMHTHVYMYTYHIISYHTISIYPPTPALAKAGAAPGTTAGVELILLSGLLALPF